MIEQSIEEVADSMQQNPKEWAEQYIQLKEICQKMENNYNQLVLALLPTDLNRH
jgi:pyruvate-formate lyase